VRRWQHSRTSATKIENGRQRCDEKRADNQHAKHRQRRNGKIERQEDVRKRVDATAKNGQQLAALQVDYDGFATRYNTYVFTEGASVGSRKLVSGLTGFTQFVRVGAYSFLAAGSFARSE
jgi:hypothetical protein